MIVVVQPHTGHIDVAWQEDKLVMPPSAMALLASLENGEDPMDLVRAARQVSAKDWNSRVHNSISQPILGSQSVRWFVLQLG